MGLRSSGCHRGTASGATVTPAILLSRDLSRACCPATYPIEFDLITLEDKPINASVGNFQRKDRRASCTRRITVTAPKCAAMKHGRLLVRCKC